MHYWDRLGRLNDLREKAETMTLPELAEYFGKSVKSVTSACYRYDIEPVSVKTRKPKVKSSSIPENELFNMAMRAMK